MPVKYLGDKNSDGVSLGQSATDLVSLYGTTPVAQRASSIQATSLLSASASMTSANLASFTTEVANTLINLGAWKGAA